MNRAGAIFAVMADVGVLRMPQGLPDEVCLHLVKAYEHLQRAYDIETGLVISSPLLHGQTPAVKSGSSGTIRPTA